MFSVYLTFVDSKNPRLLSVSVKCEWGTWRSVRGKSEGAFTGSGTFQWTKAVKGMCILFLRAALSQNGEAAIEGKRESPALSLSYAIAKKPSWLIDMFGRAPSGQSNVDRIFKRTAECRGEGYARVSLNPKNLLSTDIHVEIKGKRCVSAEILSRLLKHIEEGSNCDEGRDINVTSRPVQSIKLALTSPGHGEELFVPLATIEHHLSCHLSSSSSLRPSFSVEGEQSASHILRSSNATATTIDLELVSTSSGSVEWRHTFSVRELQSIEGEGRCIAMILAALGLPDGVDEASLTAYAAYLRARSVASHHRESSFLEAESLLEKALTLAPSCLQAEAYLAKILQQRYTYGWGADDSTLDRAAELTRRTLISAPPNGTAHLSSEHLAYFRGRPEDALILSRQALLHSPSDLDVRTAYAKSLLNVGHGGRAHSINEELYSRNPRDQQLLRALIRSAFASGRVTDGFERADSYLSSDSGGVSDVLKYVAYGAVMAQDPTSVTPYIEKQLATEGDNFRLLLLLGRIEALNNRQEKARQAWKEALSAISRVTTVDENSELRSVRGLLRALTGDRRGAVKDATEVLRANAGNGRLHFRQAMTFAALGCDRPTARLLTSSRRLGFLAPHQVEVEESLCSFGSFVHTREYQGYRSQVESYRDSILPLFTRE